jgi:hypothetical protein
VLKSYASSSDTAENKMPYSKEYKGSAAKMSSNWFRRMIGKSMGAMLLDAINPIVANYPELKPPELE